MPKSYSWLRAEISQREFMVRTMETGRLRIGYPDENRTNEEIRRQRDWIALNKATLARLEARCA
jgi:hypothetical protein